LACQAEAVDDVRHAYVLTNFGVAAFAVACSGEGWLPGLESHQHSRLQRALSYD